MKRGHGVAGSAYASTGQSARARPNCPIFGRRRAGSQLGCVAPLLDGLDRDPDFDALNRYRSTFVHSLRAALTAATATEREDLLGGILHDPGRSARFVNRALALFSCYLADRVPRRLG
jgi:hypothetical protein